VIVYHYRQGDAVADSSPAGEGRVATYTGGNGNCVEAADTRRVVLASIVQAA
jgi:hypothetical protein